MPRRKLSAKARRRLLRGLAVLAAIVIVPIAIIVLVLDRRVTAQFEGRRWTLPARVYAQPVELYVGQTLSAERCAQELSDELDIAVTPVRELGTETRRSDIWVTCTTSRRWFVGRDHVAPGSLVLAVGADDEEKQEIEPALLAESTVVTDVLDQCAAIGDLHHALELGVMRREDVHAELADVVSGRRPGRQRDEEIIVFDSTGTALQDVAAAQLVYQRAVATGVGMYVDLTGSAAPNVHAVAHR